MRRPRLLLYAALALCLPLPAFALTRGGDGTPSAPAALSVSASLDSCGLLETQVVCKLDVSYGTIPEATTYTASVTRADGSVVDYGDIGGGGAALWVPYVGDGTYTVQVSAYGEPDEPGGHPELLTRDQATAGGKDPRKAKVGIQAVRDGARADHEDGPSSGEHGDGGGGEPVEPAPSCEETDPPTEPPADEPPTGDDGTPSPGSGEGAEGGAAGTGDASAREPAPALGDVPEATAAALESEGELPDAVDCPEG